MRKVNGLSLIFIDFYVTALTPRLNITEPSLQLSENVAFFATCRIYRVSQEECARLREVVPCVRVCRYYPKTPMSKVDRLRR
jgi:hypothetical protein